MSYRRTHFTGGRCNSNTVASGQLLPAIFEGNLECQYGCSGSISSMAYYCTDFSISENWAFGERRVTYDFTASINNTVTIGFSRCCWLHPFNGHSWNVTTTFSLVVRNDTGKINSSPRAITSPVLRLQQGCNHTIVLAVSDPDGDIIRCRWAVGTECSDICDKIPGAVLNSSSCTIHYPAVNGTGYKAVALMIEDFIPGTIHPLSSVGLQFLILVVDSDEPCSLQPEFIEPTLSELCLAIPPGETFSTQLIATSHNDSVSIAEIQTVSPRGTSRGELQHIQGTNNYYVNITWTPTADQQNETHLFCFTAVNSEGLSSEQSCLEFSAGHYPPAPYPFISIPKVNPSNVLLQVRFNRIIQRPSKTAFIRFYELASEEEEVYKIDASLSQEVVFNNSTEITISPNYVFMERSNYYLNFDRGIVQGMEGCGPVNEPVVNQTFWSFEVLDITPPEITVVKSPTISNGTIGLQWNANENVTWACKLTSHNNESIINCSEGRWMGSNLSEGTYELSINATDDAKNMAAYVHTFMLLFSNSLKNFQIRYHLHYDLFVMNCICVSINVNFMLFLQHRCKIITLRLVIMEYFLLVH